MLFFTCLSIEIGEKVHLNDNFVNIALLSYDFWNVQG